MTFRLRCCFKKITESLSGSILFTAALAHLEIKIIFIYPILGLGLAPYFILCLKQAIKSTFTSLSALCKQVLSVLPEMTILGISPLFDVIHSQE